MKHLVKMMFLLAQGLMINFEPLDCDRYLRKGAALNTVQIAELLIKKYLK